MSLTTKSIATVTLSVAMVLVASFAFATPAKAQSISDLQAMVNQLLAQIAALGGGTTTGGSCNTFTRNHQMGDTGGEVKWIQQFLNSHGAEVSATGAGSPGNESDYFGAKSRAAVAKFQTANGITPAAGYWGPITRAKANSMCVGGPGVPGTPISGNGLKVMLAIGSPNNVALVQDQAIGELARFTFQNPTGSPIMVTSLGFNRIGTSADATLENVYLFNGAARITDSAGISTGAFSFNDGAGIFTVPAGGSVDISVRSDIADNTNGQQVGVALVSVGASGTLDSSVKFPINGGIQSISSADLGTVSFGSVTPAGGGTENPGTDLRVFESSVSVSTHSAWLKSITFEQRGSADNDDLKNLKLFIDGTQVGNAVASLTDDKVTFDLNAAPKKLETGTRIFKVMADIVGGAGENFDFQVRRAGDAMIVDAELNQPIKSAAADAVSGFPVAATSATNIGTASLSIVRKADSPSDNIAVGSSNVLLARYEVRASGENVKIEALTASSTVSAGQLGLDNVKVFLNGVQVGSTKDIATGATAAVEFTFGSSLIARQGQVEILEIYADAKNAAGTNLADGDSVLIGVTVTGANTEGMDSGDALSTITNVVGFTRSVVASTGGLSKASGYGNQTMVAGTNNAKLGSFTISAGSTEGVNVNTITIALSSQEAASISDLMLKDSNGVQIGTTKVTPSDSNSFSVNIAVPTSGTKTIDLFGNIKSNASAATWEAVASGSGTGAVTAQTVPLPTTGTVTLQTITVGNGSLTVTRDAGTPVNSNIIAGSTGVLVGKFDFAAVSSGYTVQELIVKVPADAATSVSNVTLKYKNQAGVEQTVVKDLTLPTLSQTHATATFTGLTFYVPQNDSADIDVYVDTPTVTSGAKSGAAISVSLENDTGFKATDGAGNQDTTLNAALAADIDSTSTTGYGAKYVKKSIPTLTRLSTGYTANTVASGIGLYRFTMTADAAGAIEWREISFTISSSGVNAVDYVLYDVTGTAVAVNTANANLVGAGTNLAVCPGTGCTGSDQVEQVGAGSSRTYELRPTTVNGWGNSGDSITLSFAEDTTAVVNAAAGSVGSSPNFIWSDRSSNSHTTLTADWTNGYLVKDTDADTRSCQFGSSTTCTP